MSQPRNGAAARRLAWVVGIAVVLAMAVSWAPGARAATTTATSKKSTGSAKTKTKAGAKTRSKTAKAGKANSKKEVAKEAPLPAPKGKVAVLGFDGDGANPLRARIVRLLRAKGLKVITTLRPVDTPEQYREMADTLVLVAFLDGEAAEDGDQASVTVHVRSGVSGLRVASATLSGERRKLTSAIDHDLWAQLAPPLSRACADAAKPRKREREPMRIEAGTPLGNDNPDGPPKGT